MKERVLDMVKEIREVADAIATTNALRARQLHRIANILAVLVT